MAMVALTDENFAEYLGREGILLIDWWAPWCGPCRVFAPIYESVAERYPNVTFGSVNTDEEPQLAHAFEIRSIPTLMVFRDRVLIFASPGVLPAEAVDELVAKVQELNMDDVHRQVAAQEAQVSLGDNRAD